MNEKMTGFDWFNMTVRPFIENDFKIKIIEEKDGDLGDLSGMQFDSNSKGGYAYFWSSGFVGFQLVDYIKEIELIEDTTMEIGSKSYQEIFGDLIDHLK